jgi:S1-C subfamily serine protease
MGFGDSQATMKTAGANEAGVTCPHCDQQTLLGQNVAQCARCATVHHRQCWEQAGGCGSYTCAPARRENLSDDGSKMVLTSDELDSTIPLPPPRPSFDPPVGPPMSAREMSRLSYGTSEQHKVSRLAIAAIICAAVGVLLFGIPGIVAMILACLAMVAIQRGERKGMTLAAVAMALGLIDIIGWMIVFVAWDKNSPPMLRQANIVFDPSSLQTLDKTIADPMRANVVVTAGSSLRERLGSGVVLKITNDVANVVTNRHVIDASFTDQGKNDQEPDASGLQVRMLGQPPTDAKVLWVAPDGIDLAIISVPCRSSEVRAASYPATKPPTLGDPVSAIGNPHSLGWSFTPGWISQFRVWQINGHDINVIQTSAPINSGNSGGGLYDKQGCLIGINTWTEDKRYSEGLGFSISAQVLLDLAPADMLQRSTAPPTGQPRSP